MFKKYKTTDGIRGERQRVSISNSPSTISENQILRVKFPNLGENDLIIPGTTRLAFNLNLSGTDVNRTLVQNIGRALVGRIGIRIAGNEVFTLDNADIYHCYNDCWLTENGRKNMQYRGIDMSENQNVTKIRVGAGDKDEAVVADKNVATALSNRFYIPLDFEILDTDYPYNQSAFKDVLEYELTIRKFADVIKSTNSDAKFTIENITLEFEKLINKEEASLIRSAYSRGCEIKYDRIFKHRTIQVNKKDPRLNIDMNFAVKSLKGILLLFKETEADFAKDSEKFYNPKVKKVDVTINGNPNQLYSSGLLPHNQMDEARKMFGGGVRNDPISNSVNKELHHSDITIDKFYNDKFCLWFDFRSGEKDHYHNTGRELVNTGDGISLQLTKEIEAGGTLECHVYVVSHGVIEMKDNMYNGNSY